MQVTAHLRQLRIAPRKVRLVVNAVRGMSVDQAERQLTFLNKASALPILKLLKSAVNNAETQFKVSKDQLVIKSITTGDGITLKRWMPRAQGRATPIRKRATHVTIVLTDKAVAKKTKKTKVAKTSKPTKEAAAK